MLDNESLYTFIEPYIQTVPTGSSEAVSIIDVDDIFKLVWIRFSTASAVGCMTRSTASGAYPTEDPLALSNRHKMSPDYNYVVFESI